MGELEMINTGSLKTTMRSTSREQAGFSLLELLIAILIFSIVSGVVYGLLDLARHDRLTTTERVESMQSIRAALSTIGHDIHNAGFGFSNTGVSLTDGVIAANNRLHLTVDPYPGEDRLTPIVGGNNVPAGTFTDPKDVQMAGTDQISMLYADVSFFQAPPPPPTPGPSPTPLPGGYVDAGLPTFNPNQTVKVISISADGTTVTLDSTAQTNPASFCRVGDLYVITKGRDSALGVLTATDNVNQLTFAEGTDAPLLINRAGANRPFASIGKTPPAGTISLYRVHWVTYWVRADGALIRTVYGATGITHQPVAYGIERLDIDYIMENGDIEETPGQAAAGQDGVMGTNPVDGTNDDIELQVRQVRVSVSFRGYTRDRRNANANINNQLTKMTVSTTFNTSNVGYDAR